jgi:hypothetical protein
VSDGTRTRDFLDHNQVLYQLSYTHHLATGRSRRREEAYRAGPSSPTGVGGASEAETAWASSLVGPGGGTKTVRR